MIRPNTNKRSRKGAAVVELAVCLPVVFLLVFGAVEAASLLFARQAMVETAYEAAMVGIKHNATNADAIAAANQVVKAKRLDGLTLTFSPSNVADAPRGAILEVTARVPAQSHRLINTNIIGVSEITAKAVMVKE
jgi:Flp pilus assembly protein TadG